jgi:hypothetical protein
MAIAAESSLPYGLPSVADWVATGIAAALEASTAAAVVASAVAVCHASAESSSPSGRRTNWTRGTRGARREAASQQEVEAPVNGRRQRDRR